MAVISHTLESTEERARHRRFMAARVLRGACFTIATKMALRVHSPLES